MVCFVRDINFSVGNVNADCEKNGEEELSDQELRSCRDFGCLLGDLLRQDRHPDAEPHDGVALLGRRGNLNNGHHL